MGWLRDNVQTVNKEKGITLSDDPIDDPTDESSGGDAAVAGGDGQAIGTVEKPAKEEKPEKNPPITNEKRKIKIKYDGAETDEEVDDEKLVSTYQRARQLEIMARGKERQANELLKEQTALLESLKSDPYGVLERLGLNPDELAEGRLRARLEELSLTPEQQKIRALEKEKELYMAQVEASKNADNDRKHQASMEVARQRYETEMITGLEKTSLPRDAETVAEVASEMIKSRAALKRGDVDRAMTVDEAIARVEQNHLRRFRATAEKLEGDALTRYLGDNLAKRLGVANLTKLKGKGVETVINPALRNGDGKSAQRAKPKKLMTTREYIEQARSARGLHFSR